MGLTPLHVGDDGIGELRRLWPGRAFHLARPVVGHLLPGDRLLEPAGHEVRRLVPAQVLQHHTPDRITEPGLMTSLPAYFGAVPCVASKKPMSSLMLAPGAMPRPPTCAAQASDR